MGLIFTDIPELEGSKTEIVLVNLSELESSFEALVEKRLAHLSELSDALICDGEDFDIIKSILLSIRRDGSAEDENVIEENKREAALLYSKVSLAERLILYRHVAESFFSEHRESLANRHISEEYIASADSADKIAYLSNPFNDEAYIRLSQSLKQPRAVYCHGAEEICRAVYDGGCEYCILPVEASGAKLSAFYGQIFKYGLWKCAEHEVKTPDGYTRYALLRRGRLAHKRERAPKAHGYFLEFLAPLDESASISDILAAAEFCRMKLRRIDTVNGRVCINLKIDKSDMETFMTYIATECPTITPLGIYKQV